MTLAVQRDGVVAGQKAQQEPDLLLAPVVAAPFAAHPAHRHVVVQPIARAAQQADVLRAQADFLVQLTVHGLLRGLGRVDAALRKLPGLLTDALTPEIEFCKYTLKSLENFENKETINMEDITIEHIMPQTLNSQWKIELGNKYEQIHSEYINTIGNLTITGYNSELSNKNFELKKECYKNSNIKICREVVNYVEWKDTEIQDRARKLFEKAKKIWKLPQRYDSKNTDNLEYGKNYLLGSDINITGKKPSKLIISGNEYSVKSWKELLEKLCLELYELEPKLLRELIYNPSFKGKKQEIVTLNKEKLRAPIKIDEDLYIESNLNSNAILNYANMIVIEYELEEEVFFTLKK